MYDLIPFPSALWPTHLAKTIRCDDGGFVLGADTPLTRCSNEGRFAVEADGERCLTLLSVLCRRPVGSDMLRPIEAAALHWVSGDKALANLRLVFSDLPKLDAPADADRLQAAAYCLDEGMTPRDLMTALDLDPSVLDLVKFDPNQPRVPAGNGPESGRWRRIWDDVVGWLEEPVPEYDTDTGIEVGTRSRGRAIATNPITVGIAGTAALLGGEAAASTEASALSVTMKPTTILDNSARGLASEARVLEEMGLTRNTRSVATAEGRSIPDALTDEQSIEIKDAAKVSLTKQLRIQTEAAEAVGRESLLIVGKSTTVSAKCAEAFGRIIRRSDLGPK